MEYAIGQVSGCVLTNPTKGRLVLIICRIGQSKGQRGGRHIKSYCMSQTIVVISRSDCSWMVRAKYGFAIYVSKLFLTMYRPRQNLAFSTSLTFPTNQSI